MSGVEAWHFLRADGRLSRPPHTKVEPGQTLRLPDGERPVLCERGFHGSVHALDALCRAPGPIVCRVRHSGEIVHGDDELCSSERMVLWMADATDTLHEVACMFADEALRIAKVDDPRPFAAIEAKRRWLRGEITDEELLAARYAAWDASRVAPGVRAYAAMAATSAAVRYAAWDVARESARYAAMAATSAATRRALRPPLSRRPWDEARHAQNTILERELMKLAPEGAA